MKEYTSNNVSDTQKIAGELAVGLKGGELIALAGNLGAGKTVFVKALAKAMGINDNITSPTFVLMKVYGANFGKIKKLVHVDCYRLDHAEDLQDIGLGDYLEDDSNVAVVEWADKIKNLPDNTIHISIKNLGQEKRKITID